MKKKNKRISILLVLTFSMLVALLVPKIIEACTLWCCDETYCNHLLADCWGTDTCWEEGAEPTSYGECLARCYCVSEGGYQWIYCNPWHK
jgi:hypothetical protein